MDSMVSIPASALSDIKRMIAQMDDIREAEHEGNSYCPLCYADKVVRAWYPYQATIDNLAHESDCPIVLATRIKATLKSI